MFEKYVGKYVIVRGDRSGIFAGTLAEAGRGVYKLTECRRIWRWVGAASDFQLATDGIGSPRNSRVTVTVGEIVLCDVIEIIPATEKAEKSIKGCEEWRV